MSIITLINQYRLYTLFFADLQINLCLVSRCLSSNLDFSGIAKKSTNGANTG